MSDLYPTIWWRRERAKLADYSATVRDGKTVVSLKIAVTDPMELAHLIEQCAELKRAAAEKPRRAPKPLLLEDRRGEGLVDG